MTTKALSDNGSDPRLSPAGPRGSENEAMAQEHPVKPPEAGGGSAGATRRTDNDDTVDDTRSGDEDFEDAPEMRSPKQPPTAFKAKSKREIQKVTEETQSTAEKEDSTTISSEAVAPIPQASKDAAGMDVKSTVAEIPQLNVKKAEDSRREEHKAVVKPPPTPIKVSPALGVGEFPRTVSEWSHQRTVSVEQKGQKDNEGEWQAMPAFAPYDMYDDDDKLVAREMHESDEEDAYDGLGGAGRGYTRVQLDEDAQSATSMDENTQYLFKETTAGTNTGEAEDEEQRDAVSQMQATKDLLTEGQRIAYIGMSRLILTAMVKEASGIPMTRNTKKELTHAAEAMQMWSQKMMVRLYAHMEISTAEQLMIEQLADHGVIPSDLSAALLHNSRVNNPMAEEKPEQKHTDERELRSPGGVSRAESKTSITSLDDEEPVQPPPPYQSKEGEDLPAVRTPSQLPTSSKLDIDLRWTVLCDLFLTLIADSVYDARSRVLLERVGKALGIDWIDICRFEKRVTDALEMQQQAEKENWNEDEHKETRRKAALKKRYIVMGLATVGGGLVIGLSAGLLAPVIGAGLAAGFSTIGVAGTTGFLAGAGGAAIITTGAATSGGIIAVRAADRRTGAVKTFEYRPLHNNKRVNLIVTVSGWMTGKVDDVRLPYSTVDPVMGDIYSILWEPEMLRSMGDTINILATEALTQGLQQVLGSTILIGLMAALQLPIVLSKLAYLIDNPWTNSLERAQAAGLILADSLIDRNLGTRPITFVGYSLGCRMIFSCLQELARKGAVGLVQNVYLFGSPIVAKKDEFLKVRSVVSGRFVNGYATNDWILGYLFRMTSGGISRVAGLAPVEDIPGLENINVTEIVPGHMSYRAAMPRLLREVGWLVESDEFTEIEDPDPDNHSKRHRELINEIEDARKELEKKEKETTEAKGTFGFLQRKKKQAAQKKAWETYEESMDKPDLTNGKKKPNQSVLFDVDAIRAELEAEHMEVKELKSTLPPMKLTLETSNRSVSQPPQSSRAPWRDSGSYSSPILPKASDARAKSSSPRHALSPHDSIEDMTLSFENADLADRPAYSRALSSSHMSFDTITASSTLKPSPAPPQIHPATTGPLHAYPHSPTTRSPYISPHASYHETTQMANHTVQKSAPPLVASLPPHYHNVEHNAWADDDDDTYPHGRNGADGEVSMTFA